MTWPLPIVDPRVSLATSVAGSPAGVYAVLIGSGMSSAAGIPTGWGVVQDLVRRVAQAKGVDLDELGDEPEAWWTRTYGAEPRYDTLMEQLAPTDGARQAVLRAYFDPPPTSEGPVLPTEGHRRLARMVAKGLIRVIITTNFDRLIERALDEVGISPQVVSVPEHVASMMPLVHAPATVLKLHGDYASLQLRNTQEELAHYPEPWKGLLGRIFDEYGLLVVGWSADSDVALADALAATPSRRFPIFWAARGEVSEAARRLIAGRQAIPMTIEDADSLFVDLTDRLDRLAAAARRRGPVRFRHVVFFPPPGTVQTGWTDVPLLQLRAGVQIGPAAGDSVEPIDIPDRTRLVQALNAATLTEQLRVVAAACTPTAAATEPAAAGQHSLDAWHPPDDSDQTTLVATYRLGGTQTAGVGALVNVRMPDPMHGAALNVTVDVGLTVAEQLNLPMVAVLLRDALLAAAVDVGATLGELLPPDATVTHVECHIDASTNDGHGSSRSNGIEQRLVWPWPRAANRPLTTLRIAAHVQASFDAADAADMVERGVRLMLLNAGVPDPDPMVDGVHQALRATP